MFKEELYDRLWVKGFKVKVDQDKLVFILRELAV